MFVENGKYVKKLPLELMEARMDNKEKSYGEIL